MFPQIALTVALRILHLGKSASNRLAGQGMVEYALLLMLIGGVVLVVLIVVGNQVQNVFNNVSCAISALGGSCAPPPHDLH